jgi:AcrR family transcriptional regulator
MSTHPPSPHPRGRRPRAAPRERLSREAIVAAALAIVDEHGVDGLSMRAVAEALGTGPSSLYAHVADKEELLELLLDAVLVEVRLPDAGLPWEEQLKGFVREQIRVLVGHRDLARVTLARVPTGPNAVAIMDRFLGNLLATGLPPRTIGLTMDLLALYAGAVAYEQSLFTARLGPEEADRYFREVREHFAALPADRFPSLHAMLGPMFDDAEDGAAERLEWALDVLVDGIAAQVRRARGPSAARGTARSPR